MKRKLTRNLGLKLLSLLGAFMIWLLVANIDDPTNTVLFRNIKIQTVNEDSVAELDKVFDVVEDDVYGETVIIRVKERNSVLKKLRTSDFKVIADMETMNDLGAIPLRVECSNPAVSQDEMEVIPSVMKVKMEQKKQSEFMVTVTTTGSTANGYAVGTKEVVQGKTVQIAGPESMLKKIGQVVAEVNVDHLRTDQRKTAVLKVIDKNGDTLTEASMSRLQIKDSNGVLLSDNEVLVDITMWKVLNDIPVEVQTVGSVASGYRVSGISTVPVTISLVGTDEALARLNGKIQVKDRISIEGATENVTQELDLTETLADIEGLRLVTDADPTISVTVQVEKSGDQTISIPLSNLEVLNRPAADKMKLAISPADEVQITVHADEGSSYLTLADIRAKVDLASCSEEGVYEIPVEVELPEGHSLVADVKLVVTATAVTGEAETDSTEE